VGTPCRCTSAENSGGLVEQVRLKSDDAVIEVHLIALIVVTLFPHLNWKISREDLLLLL